MALAFLDEEVIEGLSKELQSGRYLNLSKINGEKKVRFFGQGLTGWEAWTDDKTPIRWETKPSEYPANIKRGDDNSVDLKRFVAGIVYDYEDDQFKIMNINKPSVLTEFFKYCKTPEYGDPQGYDIKFGKTGSGMDTKYTTLALPPKSVPDLLIARFKEECSGWCLAAIFDGDDPFGGTSAA